MATPRICLSLAAPDTASLLERAERAEGVDLVEVRLDYLDAPTLLGEQDLEHLVAGCPVPVLATCRPRREGGRFEGPEGARRGLLERALAAGVQFVDVEVDAAWAPDLVERWRDRVVLSHHWDVPVDDVTEVVDRVLALRPAVGKLVAMADSPRDAVALLEAADRLEDGGVRAACFCMGESGAASRLLAAARGGYMVYATSDGPRTAPGQWPVETLLQDLRLPEWQPGARIFGVVGEPVSGSLSPLVFNAAFQAARIDALYVPLPGSPFASVLALAERAGVRGLSVTMPYKHEALFASGAASDLAQDIGAANTLTWKNGAWEADNTDGPAVVAALEGATAIAGSNCAILGAGGAARAAAVSLVRSGARVTVLNRTVARAEALAGELGCRAGPLDELASLGFDVVVNATPAGMAGTVQPPVSTDRLRGDETVLDMVYRPLETEFLRQARELGCRTVSGLEMFLRQADLQYRSWTGLEAPAEVMRRAATNRLAAESAAAAEEGRR